MATDFVKDKTRSRFQTIIFYALIGAASGIIIDQTLKPKLSPARI